MCCHSQLARYNALFGLCHSAQTCVAKHAECKGLRLYLALSYRVLQIVREL